MIIINADDFGRSREETDAALRCFEEGRITSTSAMVFMDDSCRAADLALTSGIDVGLHLNLSQSFATSSAPKKLRDRQDRVVQFFTFHKYSLLVYNPALRAECRYVYQAQLDEFVRLFGRAPSHIDGHQHKHLCTNLLVDGVIPARERVRRSFSFWPGEKGIVNRGYRRLVDHVLARRYRVTDFFFGLQQCLELGRMPRVFELARSSSVELMTHPMKTVEYDYLMSDEYLSGLRRLSTGTYGAL